MIDDYERVVRENTELKTELQTLQEAHKFNLSQIHGLGKVDKEYRALLEKVRAQKPSAEEVMLAVLRGCDHVGIGACPTCVRRAIKSERLVAAIEQERLLAALDSTAWLTITERESGQEYEICEECRTPKGDSHKASCVIGTALDFAPSASAELAELRAKAARLDALNAEAAQILPTPVDFIRSNVSEDSNEQWSGTLFPKLEAALLSRDLLHLARRDAGFAALRAALKGQSFSSVCICAACLAAISALAATEPGAALGTVIEALKESRKYNSVQIMAEYVDAVLRALGKDVP